METQDASTEFLFKLWPWLEANKTRLIGGAVAIVVIAGIYSFVSWQHQANELAAGQAFTQLAISSPANANPGQLSAAFSQLATKYAGTEAGQRAQLQAAATQFEAGNYADAQTQFQKFLDANSSGQFAGTAALGVAVCLDAQGKSDLATVAYQKVASGYTSSAAALPAQFALGRLAEQAGKLNDAVNFYTMAAAAGRAGGSVAEEAQGRVYELKTKLAATQKAITTTTTSTTNAIPVLKK